MDIQKYISSGILEQYVLGDLSAQQQQEVETNAQKYPEIKAEIDAIESALENIAQAASITPPAGLEIAILEKIEDAVKPNSDSNTNPPTNNSARGNNPFKGLSLLAGLMLLGATIWGFMQSQANATKTEELETMTQKFEQLQADCAKLQSSQRQDIAFLKDVNTKPIQMKGDATGTNKAPDALAIVYWNNEKREAYLDTGNIPAIPSTNEEYELWAVFMVDGKPSPISMGVFDKNATDSAFLQVEVPFAEQPAAFAVTLEKKDGNPAPTLEEMYVIGNNT